MGDGAVHAVWQGRRVMGLRSMVAGHAYDERGLLGGRRIICKGWLIGSGGYCGHGG